MKLTRFFFALLAVIGLSAPAHAVLTIDVNGGQTNPLPIAIPEFIARGNAQGLNAEFSGVVAADLERSGLFRPINAAAHIEKISSDAAIPNFASWRQINAQALVVGSISVDGERVRVTFRLWDVLGEEQVAGKEFNTKRSNWRRMAHIVADEIYKRLTGEEAYFDSRIVYVAESGPKQKRTKRLAIMDQDGADHKFLTDPRYMALTPRFSANSQDVVYMSFAGRVPKVYLRDLQTGREEVLGSFAGMSFAPRFSPDGRSIIMSIAENGVSNIYAMSLAGRSLRKITNGTGIDTSPSYSPDGQRITFNSDRGGSQQLYVMNADGSGIQRISFGDGKYGTPVWSPRGDLIAFTKMSGGQFYIGVMRPDGSGERVLTQSYQEEGPTWSPNGRVIMFQRQERSGRTRLFSVDLTGRNLREVQTPQDASDPAWSPLLPM